MPTVTPPHLHLGDYRRLGPDPEPLSERFEVLLRRECPNRRPRVTPRPRRHDRTTTRAALR